MMEQIPFKFDFSYQNDVVLAGIGGISENLVKDVARILENTFRFHDIGMLVNLDTKNIKPFSDSEPQFRQAKSDVKKYGGKHVFLVEHLKAYDNRLRDATFALEKRITALGLDDPDLLREVANLKYLALPEEGFKTAARFTSSSFNPSAMEKRLVGQISAAKMGGAKHITVVTPIPVFEWSHHYAEKWRDGYFEMPAWHDFLTHICRSGAHSFVSIHPHAPKESLQVAAREGLNLVMVYPQTFTLNSNGWIYSIDKFFEEFDLKSRNFDPIRDKIDRDKELLGDRKELSDLLMFSSSVDEGSKFNAEKAAQRFGFSYVASTKERHGEGISFRKSAESLETHLLSLKERVRDGMIKIYIFDDMINSGGTANEEAKVRKREIAEFNREHGTAYRIEVEGIMTHLRFHELPGLRHEHLDRITVFDTVPYIPPLKEQLATLGLSEKFNVLDTTPYQLALGVALDYFAQRFHYQLDLNPMICSYRDVTDEYMIKNTKYGQDLKNMMRHFDAPEHV